MRLSRSGTGSIGACVAVDNRPERSRLRAPHHRLCGFGSAHFQSLCCGVWICPLTLAAQWPGWDLRGRCVNSVLWFFMCSLARDSPIGSSGEPRASPTPPGCSPHCSLLLCICERLPCPGRPFRPPRNPGLQSPPISRLLSSPLLASGFSQACQALSYSDHGPELLPPLTWMLETHFLQAQARFSATTLFTCLVSGPAT